MKMFLKLVCGLIILALLFLIILYFVFTDSYVLRTRVLPVLSDATGISITAKKIIFMPFSSKFKLRNASIKFPSGGALECKEINFDYDFWNLIQGKVKGHTNITGLDINSKNLNISNLDLQQNINGRFVPFKELILNSVKTTLFTNSEEIIHINTTGTLNFKGQWGNVHLEISDFAVGTLGELPVAIIKNVLGIKQLFLNGTADFKYTNNGSDFIFITRLKGNGLKFYVTKNAPELPLISGNMEVYLEKHGNEIAVNKFICNILEDKQVQKPENQTRLGNIAATGRWYLNSTSGKSELNVYSEGLDLKELLKIFNSIAGVFKLNLKGMSFNTNFYLENITYGPTLTLSCKANANVNKGFLKINPIYVTLNNRPVSGTINYDFNAANNNYFYVEANASDIQLSPVLRAFGSKIYSKSRGNINKFSIELKGNGFSTKALEKSLNGKLTARFSDISLPDNTSQYDYIRLVFIPIEVISQINNIFGDINLPFFFTNLIQYSNSIFSQGRNLILKEGDIDLFVKNGKINIKNCVFQGDGNPIQKLKFSGEVGINQKIAINAIVKVNQLVIIPLHIGGTISKPAPDLLSFGTVLKDDFIVPAGKGGLNILMAPAILIEKISDDADMTLERLIP